MSVRVVIPLVSANAQDVTVGGWQVRIGERVRRGQPLLDVSTDKATFEVEAPVDGVLLATYAPPRSVVPVGYVVAQLGAPGEADGAIDADNAAIMARHRAALVARDPGVAFGDSVPAPPQAPARAVAPAAATAVRATPKARRLAGERGIDLGRVQAETGAEIVTEAVLAPYLDPPH